MKLEDWKEKRKSFVGASEVAALFDAHPYISLFELWHSKAGNYERKDAEGARLFWGTQLEDSIAAGIATWENFEARKVGMSEYKEHSAVKGFGATLDWEVLSHPDYDGKGCFEIKNIDWISFKEKFKIDGDNIEAPLYIELQLQAQMSVTGYKWGICGVLVGGNDAYIIPRKRNETVIKQIESGVAKFWESLKAGEAPDPAKGSDLVVAMQCHEPVQENDAVALPDEIEEFCANFLRAKMAEKEALEKKKIAQARVIMALEGCLMGWTGGYWVTYKPDKSGKRTFKIKERINNNG